MNLERFVADEEKIFAVQHALLIISEAATKLDALAPQLCPDIDWRDVRGIGNRLRHEYHGISVARLWSIVDNHLPLLKAATVAALQKLEEGKRQDSRV